MNTATTTKGLTMTCNLHLTKNCATCFKFASECDFGACRRNATHTVVAPVERRRACVKHVKDVSRNYPGATVEVGA